MPQVVKVTEARVLTTFHRLKQHCTHVMATQAEWKSCADKLLQSHRRLESTQMEQAGRKQEWDTKSRQKQQGEQTQDLGVVGVAALEQLERGEKVLQLN